MPEFPTVDVFDRVDRALFENEIKPLGQPAVLKGLVAHWPVVEVARQSPEALGAYLKMFDSGKPAQVSICPPDRNGRFFYNDDVTGFNFTTMKDSISQCVDDLLEARGSDAPEARYMQGMRIDTYAPGLAGELDMPLLDGDIRPRIWLGNTVRTQTHFDLSSNIACHIAGDKIFTLFPPEQLPNLYPGPLHLTPGGVPISMVDIEAPNLERFPRFSEAMKYARTARLEPGDALYMPNMWWHNVQTTGPLNMLVNYWWNEARDDMYSPIVGLYTAALSFKHMPEPQRKAWQNMVDYFVFETAGDPVAHLPPAAQSVFRHEVSRRELEAFKTVFRRTVKL